MTMDGNDNEEETYIEHLRSMFNELDSDKKGGLNGQELKVLSEKLSLMKSQSDLLLQLSFAKNEDRDFDYDCENLKEYVDFNKFQESFVAVLSTTNDLPTSYSDSEEEYQETKDEEFCDVELPEVKPRVVRGGKTYGRRSQPDSFNDEIALDKSSDPVEDEAEENDITSDPEDVFQNDFYELPERGAGDGVYFEASGQLRNPLLDRLRPKSTSTTLNDSQHNMSSTSLVLQTQHLFSALDKNDLGLIDYADLSEMWKSEGIADPRHVLQLLDVSIDTDKRVNAYDLSSSLENEVTSLRVSTVDSVTQAALATFKHQLAHLNGQVEQHQALLGKMKEDLEKSELRNSILVDEADDRYLHVDKSQERILDEAEKQWSRKLRQTQKSFNKDRELIQAQAMLERDALQQEIDRLMIREGSLRSTIDALQMDNDALEHETKDIVQKLRISENNAARLQRDLEQLIKEKSNSSNDSFNPSQEERFAEIIKDYEAQCRVLTDRNDELVDELEKVRAEFLQSMRKSTGENAGDKSSSRKRARRRGSSADYIGNPGQSDSDLSDFDGDEIRMELGNKIANMEKTIQKLEEEKAILTTRFTEEKSLLRSQVEAEFINKLEGERKKMVSFEEMTKSEKNTAINQALADGRKQQEELEKRIKELREALEAEQLNSQQTVSNLCREFESDKNEMQNKNSETIQELQDEVSDLQQQLEKEIEAHEMTSRQLNADRAQHKAAMQAHSETISKLERSTKQNSSSEKDEVQRLTTELHQLEERLDDCEKEKQKIVAEHQVALDLTKAEMQSKIEDIVTARRNQERSSICNELDRMHENVIDERQQMQQRVETLKQAFDAEAEELKTLVELEKCELRKALAEESATLRRKLAEEHEKVVEKKRRQLEEEEREQRESQINHFEEIIKNLQAAKHDLEEQLRDATDEKRELEKEVSDLKFEKETNSDSSQLQQVVEEKTSMNTVLQSQITELRMKHLQTSQEYLQVKTLCDAKTAELVQIVKEKQEYADKIIQLENEKSSYLVENARLVSKNIELGKSEAEIFAEEYEKKVTELKKKLTEQEEICVNLQEKLKKFHSMEHGSTTNEKKLSQADAKTKYEHTRHQLIQQMNKTKDMYSKLARSEALIKDLYCENAELMHALQLTEDRYKSSERRITVEADKNVALTSLLHKICPEAV